MTTVSQGPVGSLDGVVVADFTRVLAGPYATMLLGDLGAQVVKVERAGVGDDTRSWAPPRDAEGRATYFESVNRNKRSLSLDLRDPADRERALTLALSADVVVENFVPGTMEKFGLGFEQLRALNPGVVYASITGFGTAPAGRELPGYDLLVQASGGLMSVTGATPGQPTKVGVAVVDVITGLHLTIGVLAALRHRDRTGEGQRVDVALLSSLLSALVNQSASYVNGGVVPGIMGNAHPSIVPYESYPTADRDLVIAVGNDGQFRSLCRVLGHEQWADDARFATNTARVAHRHDLGGLLVAVLRTRKADEWWSELTPAGVPCGPINDIAEAFALAESVGLEPVAIIDDPDRPGMPTVANPIRLSATPPTYRLAPPSLEGQV